MTGRKNKMEENNKLNKSKVQKEYQEMIIEDPESFCNIPVEYKSTDLCMDAVKSWGYNLEFVPEGLKTREMCRNALISSPDLGYGDYVILAHVPFSDVCLEGIKKFENGLDIMDVVCVLRKEVIDEKIANYIVGQDGCCLGIIPLQIQSEELALKAVAVSGNQALGYTTIREDLKTEKIYIAGMEQECFQSYLHIPEHKRTPEICLVAEKLYPDLFAKRPEVLPAHVTTGCNIYTLSKILERATGEKYNINQVKGLYNGEKLQAKKIITPNGVLKNQEVHFDKDRQEFFFHPMKQEKRQGLKM